MRTMPALESVDLAQIDNTTIPASCFKESTVKMVILPLNLEAIPNNAFYQSKITSIDIPSSVVSIGVSAFESCTSLAGDLILPNGLQSIGSKAFYSCSKLIGNLIIPDNVTSIGSEAFYRCSKFTSLTLGKGITTIPSRCFFYCEGFSGNLIIPDQVTEIEQEAFCHCTGFNGYLTIGSGIKKIGTFTFTDDNNNTFGACAYPLPFTKVYCKAITPPILGNFVFCKLDQQGGVGKYDYLGVPIGCKTTYNKNQWKESFEIIEEVEF